jgi:ABC-2 type transport system permease protein
MGVVITCLGLRFIEGMLSNVLRAMEPPNSWKLLANPAYDADLLRAALLDPSQLGQASGSAGPALLVLAIWIAALAAGAVVLFRRQDLTKE